MSTYKVVYERDEEGWWIARVVGVLGVHSNGRTIEEAKRRVREALSLAVDDADSAEFVDDVRLPPGLRQLLKQQKQARALVAKEQRRATELERSAAKRLSNELGLSRRDVGALLGVSHQMVQKLTQRPPEKRARSSARARPQAR